MILRSNKVFEETVTKAVELSLEGDDFGAVAIMKDQGIPVKVMARVLCDEHRIRSTDLPFIAQHSK